MKKEMVKAMSLLAVAAVLTLAFGSCSGKSKSPLSMLESSTEKFEVDGQSFDVDTAIANHYIEDRIIGALKRKIAQKNKVLPTDASTFGKKIGEVHWRAFEDDMKDENLVREVGEVTVVHYEKGLEIIKDGKSWFYDVYKYDKAHQFIHITAGISILDRERWEPVYLSTTLNNCYMFEYMYPEDCYGVEFYSFIPSMLRTINVNNISDMWLPPYPETTE